MNAPCPECGKLLSVKDDFAGRRIRCPACKHVFQVAKPEATDDAISAEPIAVKRSSAPPPFPDAVKPGKPAPAVKRCPRCGAARLPDGLECSECDWTADALRAKKPRHSLATGDDEGRCYVHIRNDEVSLNEAIEQRLEKMVETEQLDMEIMDRYEELPDELGPNDAIISGDVTYFSYGSQLVRYVLTFIAIFGPGSCEIYVEAEVETAEGEPRRIKTRARQAVGILGGTGTGLMKVNVQVVANQIAYAAIRHITGRWFLNLQVYHTAYWSLGLGIAALIPYLGVLFGLISPVLGGIALLMIQSRGLPRGRWPAIVGIAFSMLGFCVTAGFILLSLADKR